MEEIGIADDEVTVLDLMNAKGVKREKAQRILLKSERSGKFTSRWCIDNDGKRRKAYRKK